VDRLEGCLRGRVPLARGRLVGTDRILTAVADKRALARTGALGADMETAAVAQVARGAGIPWIAVRAVADSANVALPPHVMLAVDVVGRIRTIGFIMALGRHPRECLQLPGLARGFRAALTSLRTVAQAAGPALLAPGTAAAGDMLRQTAGSEAVS